MTSSETRRCPILLYSKVCVCGETSAEGIAPNLYYRWSKDFPEVGKKGLAGDTVREATSSEVKDLRNENLELKQVVVELTLHNRVLKRILMEPGDEGVDK